MICRPEEESFLHSHSYLLKSSIRGRIVSENCFQEYGVGLRCQFIAGHANPQMMLLNAKVSDTTQVNRRQR